MLAKASWKQLDTGDTCVFIDKIVDKISKIIIKSKYNTLEKI